MNIHRRDFKIENKRKGNKGKGNYSLVSAFFGFLIIIAPLFIALNFRTSCKEETEANNKAMVKMKADIILLNREIVNLRNKKEKMSSWRHIKRKIKQFNLGLITPAPSQFRTVVIYKNYKNDSGNKSKTTLAKVNYSLESKF